MGTELACEKLHSAVAFFALLQMLFLPVLKAKVGFLGFRLRQMEQSHGLNMFHTHSSLYRSVYLGLLSDMRYLNGLMVAHEMTPSSLTLLT